MATFGYDRADRHLSTSNGTTTSAYVRDLAGEVVEYWLNGVIQNRYSGNTTLDATGVNVVERTIGLPGGVTLTTRAGGDVWSYPNIAGSVATTANSTGAKTAGPLLYDPYATRSVAIPTTKPGTSTTPGRGSTTGRHNTKPGSDQRSTWEPANTTHNSDDSQKRTPSKAAEPTTTDTPPTPSTGRTWD